MTLVRSNRFLTGVQRLALILTCLASLFSFGVVQPVQVDASAEEVARVIALTNAERQKAGLQPLVANPNLTGAADGYSVVLASGDCWAHTCGPEPDFQKRAQNAGYTGYTALAENIAAGYSTPEDVVRGWMESEGHRRNIMNPAFNEIGVGVARGGRMRIYWTQVFGARRGVTTQPAAQPSATPTRTPTRQATPTATATPVPPAPAASAPAIEAIANAPAEPAAEPAPEAAPEAAPAEAPAAAEAAPPTDEAALAASLGMNVLELQTLNLINLDRLSRGLHPLIFDHQLAEVARAHARDMMTTGVISHTGSDGSTPLERMRRGGVRVTWGGENIWTYWGKVPHEGPPTMHKAMMDEPHEPGLWNHIANILLPTYKRVGIGVVVNPNGVQYLVEDFAD